MSTYENPTTVIDRESGKIWGETIQNIGKLTVSTLDNIQKRKSAQVKREDEENKALSKNLLDRGNETSVLIRKSGLNDPAVIGYLRAIGDDIARAQTKTEYSGSREETQQNLNIFNKLQANRDAFVVNAPGYSDGVNSYRYQMIGEDAKGNPIPAIGAPGGMATTGNDGKTQRYHKIMQAVSRFPDKGNLKSFEMRDGMAYGVLEGVSKEIDGEELNLTLEMAYDPGNNIDFLKEMKTALDESNLYDEEGVYKKKFELTNQATIEKTADGMMERTVIPYNYAAISQEAAMVLDAKTEGIMDAYSYNDMNNWWLNNGGHLAPPGKDLPELSYTFSGGRKVLDDKGKETFKSLLLKDSQSLLPAYKVSDNEEIFVQPAARQGKLTKVSDDRVDDLSDRELDAQDIKNEASREVTELIENPGEVILTKYRRNLPGAKVSDDGQVITVIKESKYVGEEDEVVEFDLRDPKSIYSLYEEIIQPSNISETKLLKQIEKQAEKQIKDIKSNTRAKAEKGLNDMLKKYKDSRK